jgi:1-acyl-sn-glycerol-3-phosphate acyltransferase
MKPPPLLVRRAVIDPVWIPLAVVLAALFVAVALVGLVILPLGRHRLPRFALFAALYLLLDASLILGCALLWLRHPVPGRRGQDWADAHQRMLHRMLRLLVRAAKPLLGFEVELEELPDQADLAGRPLLVLARHGGPGDSFAIAELLLSRLHRRPVIVLKEVLRWDPGLDLLLSRMPSCFLPARGAGHDLPALIAQAARGLGDQDALLIFPEGGNWTPHRYRLALNKLRARGRRRAAARAAANPHVLPPQPAGVLACLAARPGIEIVVVAHTGLDDLVSAAQMWRAVPVTGRPMVMRWWHMPASELPSGATLQQEWLEVQWAIVDSWIDARKAARRREQQPVLPAPQPTTGAPTTGAPTTGAPTTGAPAG